MNDAPPKDHALMCPVGGSAETIKTGLVEEMMNDALGPVLMCIPAHPCCWGN